MTAERVGTQASDKRSRRRHSMHFKLRVVREALKPGISIREVARRHGLHESLVGVWRGLYSRGNLETAQSGAAEVKLLPVQARIESEERASPVEASILPRSPGGGAIHIEFSHGHRLSVRGEVAASTLSAVIRELSRS